MSADKNNGRKSLSTHLLAGGAAGLTEALCCHPLDTIKVRMQLRRPANFNIGFIGTAKGIVTKEGPLALYKGLGAVVAGIVPKMAIRFSSFELYKSWLANKETGKVPTSGVFVAGLGAGVTEAVLVVTPMDVLKIRLQAQRHSMMDPLDVPKYRNAAHAGYTIIREEGVAAMYKGVTLTALRQATNQAVNFTVYQEMKKQLQIWQPEKEILPSWQHLLIGGLSGAMGPMSNAPIDTIKTRIQRASGLSGESGWTRFTTVTRDIIKNEGYAAFYKGLTPRLLRVAPGQAITFMVYERVRLWIESSKINEGTEERSRIE
ncbi:mitochondrial carrier domain-containing protein [Piptocephalis cylindrospora]|uniref:Mitochondrial carrier domain-containing protein n=1 Tax=Piptocephalis cylindrospora TaxID=1907219 RepID=A0A4P9Y779_9FUNG|nr:mitochondrial carrier domain-containing protein [Piptocephalis cylindrospora]|eukprot:RKP14966.1 mitochondrial carrier domain-containing protein [Piptocephalis cylindrospora]